MFYFNYSWHKQKNNVYLSKSKKRVGGDTVTQVYIINRITN